MQTQSEELRIGETVRLNSGGPNSEIIASSGGRVTVKWEVEPEVYDTWNLPAACFRRVESVGDMHTAIPFRTARPRLASGE